MFLHYPVPHALSLTRFPAAQLAKFQQVRDDLMEHMSPLFFVPKQICPTLVCVTQIATLDTEHQIQETPWAEPLYPAH